MRWDFFKYNARNFVSPTQKYFKRKKKKKKDKIGKTKTFQKQIYIMRKNLNEIVDEVMEINQIQNSCQWYELGEKLTVLSEPQSMKFM